MVTRIAQAATPMRLPIVKYSYASGTLPSDTNVQWTHTGRPDMFAVFDSVRFGVLAPGIALKIMHEAEILELVQLENLCRAASNAILEARQWGRQYMQNDLPIHAVVRSPRLAMTYRSEDGSIRRFQLRFGTNADFDNALGVIRSLQCPITTSVERPSTAQESNYPPTPASQVAERPSTAGSASAFALPALPIPRRVDPTRLTDGSSPLKPAHNITNSDFYNEHLLRASSPFIQRPFTSPASGPLQHTLLPHPARQNIQYESQYDRRSPLSEIVSFRPSSASHSVTRPLTAPVSSLPETLSQVLPQRRDLPFAARDGPAYGHQKRDQSDPRPTPHLESSSSQNGNKRKRPNDESPFETNRASPAPEIGRKHIVTDMQLAGSRQQENSQPGRGHDEDDLTKELHAYANKPTSERQALIDDMLCSYINNDAFITLCEDVENSWRRIGFDLRR